MLAVVVLNHSNDKCEHFVYSSKIVYAMMTQETYTFYHYI